MPNITTLSIRARLILAFVLVLLIPTVTIGAYSTGASSSALVEAARVREQKLIESEAKELGDQLGLGVSDLLSLVQAPAIGRYVNGLNDDVGNRATLATPVTTLFGSFLKSNSGVYKDLRIINASGQEILRVDDTGGAPAV